MISYKERLDNIKRRMNERKVIEENRFHGKEQTTKEIWENALKKRGLSLSLVQRNRCNKPKYSVFNVSLSDSDDIQLSSSSSDFSETEYDYSSQTESSSDEQSSIISSTNESDEYTSTDSLLSSTSSFSEKLAKETEISTQERVKSGIKYGVKLYSDSSDSDSTNDSSSHKSYKKEADKNTIRTNETLKSNNSEKIVTIDQPPKQQANSTINYFKNNTKSASILTQKQEKKESSPVKPQSILKNRKRNGSMSQISINSNDKKEKKVAFKK